MKLLLGLLALAAGLCSQAWCQPYPSQPVHVIVPMTAGGPTDILTRAVATRFGEALGQQMIVENRGGAGGTIATDAVAKSAPDGYTLLAADLTIATTPSLYNVSYSLRDSFSPVGLMALAPLVLVVNTALPVKTVKELVNMAHNQPGKLSYGAPTATPTHFGPEVLKEAYSLDVLFVPYKGIAPALVDLIGGRLTFAMLGVSGAKSHIEAGKLRVLAITGTRRAPSLPNVPTFAEAGFPLTEMDYGAWWGIVAPAGLPNEVLRKLNDSLNKALASPDVRERLIALNYEPHPTTPEEFGGMIQKEAAKWARVIQRAGIKAD